MVRHGELGAAGVSSRFPGGWPHVHNRLERRLRRLASWIDIQESNLARLRVDWEGIPESTLSLSSEHPYAADLDLLGKYSLFRLLDTTVLRDGQLLLVAWLTRQYPHSFDQWENRQKLVRALTPLRGLRDRIQLVAKCLSPNPINTDRLESLLETSLSVAHVGPLLLTASALAGFNMVLFCFLVAWWAGLLDRSLSALRVVAAGHRRAGESRVWAGVRPAPGVEQSRRGDRNFRENGRFDGFPCFRR